MTREKETVWEWISPFVRDNHRVQIYRMERLQPEIIEPLLAGP